MTPHEIELAKALGCVSGWAGARFLDDIASLAARAPESELTARQRYYMGIMAWRYRKQLPRHLVPETKPLDLPPQRKEPKKSNKPTQKVATPQMDLFA